MCEHELKLSDYSRKRWLYPALGFENGEEESGNQGLYAIHQRALQHLFTPSIATSAPFLSLDIAKDGSAIAAGTELTHSQATVQVWCVQPVQEPKAQPRLLIRYTSGTLELQGTR